MSDFIFTDHGSLWMARPMNDDARQHLEENVSDEAQWMGGALAVEPRYVAGLVDGLQNSGYEVTA